MPESKPILDFFKEHNKEQYELIFVLDIDYSTYPYYYRVLVKNIDTGYYTTVFVPPELLRYRYKIGTVYKGTRAIGKNTLMAKATFPINTKKELTLVQIKDVIDATDSNLVDFDYFNNFYQKQYCYFIELENCSLIIPSYTIANRFYFLSSSMKKAVFKGTLSSLHEEPEFHKKGHEVFITIKNTAAKRDYPFICRFLEDMDAHFNLNYFMFQKSSQTKNLKYGQVKAKFPVNDEFEIDVSYIKLNKEGKPKLLVLDIFNDTSPLNFSKINVRKFVSKSGKFEQSEINIGSNKKFKKKLPRKVNHVIKTGTPSSTYQLKLDSDIVEKDRNAKDIEIAIEDIYKITDTELVTEYTNNTVDISFEEASSAGSDKLVQSCYSFYGETENNDLHIFNINDFFMLFELFSQQLGVNPISISNLTNMVPIKNEKGNISSKYHLASNKLRNFIFADFYHIDKYIFIIEIELDDTWKGISTWFFITRDIEFKATMEIAQKIISYYIGECKTYDELRKFVKETYNFMFYKKAHVKKVTEDNLLDKWVDDVLEDIAIY